jgi:hypothetical protein
VADTLGPSPWCLYELMKKSNMKIKISAAEISKPRLAEIFCESFDRFRFHGVKQSLKLYT